MSFLDYIRQRQKSSNITFELVYHTPKRARGNVGPFGISNMTYDVDVILRDKSTNLANTVTFRSIINNDNKSIMENVFVNGNELKNKDIFDNRADDLRLKTKEELRTHMLYKTKTLISEIYNNQALAFTSLEKFKAQTRRRAVSAFHTGVKSTLLLSTLAAVLTVFVGGFTAGGLEVIYLSKNGFIDLNQANQANLETLKFGYYFLSFVNMAIIGTAMEQMNKWMKNRLNRVYNNHIVENKSERLRKERSLYMRLSDIAMNALNTRYFSIPNLEGITQNVLNRNFNLEDYLRRYKAGDVLVKNFSTGETKRVQFGAPVAQRVVPSGGQCKLLFAN
ncbi:MAG: hypothetical protein MK008_07870 [Bdellovibrionales bacterium]|nr:hypothetical protein [Bdellovibrionales bacterium]